MNKKISIIVPVYNVEKYIDKCLDSLANLDYDNYDVFVINDGSPFNEQAIIDKYVEKYPGKINSIVKENGNYGSVLERGFKEADGEFVLVCDSDDYLSNDCLKKLMDYQEKTNADIVIGAKNYVYEDSDEVTYHSSYTYMNKEIEDGKSYKKEDEDFDLFYFMDSSPHAKLYRRNIVNKIDYPHKVSFTDTLLYYHALSKANVVAYCKEPLAYYLINRSGNTMTDVKPKIIDDHIVVYKKIMDVCKEERPIYYYFLFDSFMHIFYMIDRINSSIEEKINKYKELYCLFESIVQYKEEVIKMNNNYSHDSFLIKKQKESLLDKKKTKKTYELLYQYRMNSSFSNKIKLYLYIFLGI